MTLLLILALQDPARELIERMQSDDPAVREAATRKLAEMGKAAEPELRKAANHPDVEVAGRVRKLLRNLAIADSITPRLNSAMPAIVGRLQSGDDHQWTLVFFQLQGIPFLRREDLEPLAGPALRAARGENELMQALNIILTRRLRSASAEVADLLNHPQVGGSAFAAFRALQGRNAIPVFMKLLMSDFEPSRILAAASLGELEAVEAIPQIREMLTETSPQLRRQAARSYAQLAGRDAIPGLRKMARDPDPEVRSAGIGGLAATGLKEITPEILEAFGSPDSTVRSAAADAAAALRLKAGIPHLAAMLKDKDEGLRYDALYALEQYGNRAAANALVSMLKEKDADLRDEAFRILGGMRIREGVGEIDKLLDSDDHETRRQAMELLAIMGAKETFDRVARGLKDESEEIQSTAVYALGALDPPRAARVLVPLLAKEEHRQEVQEWLYEVRPREAIAELTRMLETEKSETVRTRIAETLSDVFETPKPVLIERLEDKDPKVRASALYGLRSAEATPLAVKRLKDTDPEVRFAAVVTLERFGSTEILGALVEEDPEVLCAAIRGIKALGLKEAAPDLIKLLKSTHTVVREESAEALGRLGAEEAAPALIQLARSPFPYVRASAARGLRGLKGPEARAAVEGLLKDPHAYVRRIAAQPEAESLQSPEARIASVKAMNDLPDIVNMLEDPSPDVVQAAALRLLAIGTKEAVVAAARAVDLREIPIKVSLPADALAGIADLLEDPDEEVRARAAGAVSALGVKGAVPKLMELLGGRSPHAIIEALAGLDAREAIPKIVVFLDHRDSMLRSSAAEALGALKAREAEPRLIDLLDDPAPEVRRAAALALAALGSGNAQPKLVEMLEDEDDPYAAAALCLLGRREGIPVILSSAANLIRLRGDFFDLGHDLSEGLSFLIALNALRAPQVLARLEGKALTGPIRGTFFDVAKCVAGEAGLAFEGEPPGDKPRNLNLGGCRRGNLWKALFSAATAIERSPSAPSEGEAILEDGRIRFVEFDDALLFWQSWAGK